MFTITLKVRSASVNTVTRLWKLEFDNDPFVWTGARIGYELARIKKTDTLSRMYNIETHQEWDSLFPEKALGCGQIVMSEPPSQMTAQARGRLIRKINFLLANFEHFSIISGLQAPAEALGIEAPFDSYNDEPIAVPVAQCAEGWNGLPEDGVLQLCKHHQDVDLWEAICRFRTFPDEYSWRALREMDIPWLGITLNELVDPQLAIYGLMPSSIEVEDLLIPSTKAA
jgi:hypothetical protein